MKTQDVQLITKRFQEKKFQFAIHYLLSNKWFPICWKAGCHYEQLLYHLINAEVLKKILTNRI